MENKNKTVIQSIDETNTNLNHAKNEIIDYIRSQNQNSNLRGGFSYINLFQTCTTVAIDRTVGNPFQSRVKKTLIYTIIQFAFSLITFIFASIFIKRPSMSGIVIALTVVPFLIFIYKMRKMKPALLNQSLVDNSPLYYKTFQGNVIRAMNRVSTTLIWFDILICLSVFCDCGEVAMIANLDSNLDLTIFSIMFILFIVQCVISGLFASKIKGYFRNYCVYYIRGYVQNNGVQPIEAIIDPTDAQIIFSIDEYNSKYPFFKENASYVSSELTLLNSKKKK